MGKISFTIFLYSLLAHQINGQVVYTMSIEEKISFERNPKSFYITGFLPHDIPNRQRVVDVRFYPFQPILYQSNGNSYYKLNIPDSAINKELHWKIEYDIELFDYDLTEARYIKDGLDDTLNLQKFLEPNFYQQSHKKRIRKIASRFEGAEEEIVRQIFDYVVERLDYEVQYSDLGANRSKTLRIGDCTEYTDLMVALCRAKGIPAKTSTGSVLTTGQNSYHHWPEVYLNTYGWIPFDPTLAESGAAQFDNLPNVYIKYSNHRYDGIMGTHGQITNYKTSGARSTVARLHQGTFTEHTAFRKAAGFYNTHHYDSAFVILDTLIARDLKNTRYYEFRGMMLARQGDFEGALKHFQLALGNAKHAIQKRTLFYSYGNFMALKGDYEQSLSFIRASLELGFRNLPHIAKDEDLVGLHRTKAFNDLLAEFGYKPEPENANNE